MKPTNRNVTTFTSAVALVVENANGEVLLLNVNSNKLLKLRLEHTLFRDITVGNWLIVGVFPDSSYAWLLPNPLSVDVSPTRISKNQVQVKANVCVKEDELVAAEWGPVGISKHFDAESYDWSKGSTAVWVQWIPTDVYLRTSRKFRWEVATFDNDHKTDYSIHHVFGNAKFVKKPVVLEDKTHLHLKSKDLRRHYGVVTSFSQSKEHAFLWSPGMGPAGEGVCLVEKPAKTFFGQWIHYDTTEHDEKTWLPEVGTRLHVKQFELVNAPIGIVFCQIGNDLKVVLTNAFVESTRNPFFFNVRDFGLVFDGCNLLRSGRAFQLLLCQVPTREQIKHGCTWNVECALVPPKGAEETQSIRSAAVASIDAFTPSTAMKSDADYIWTKNDNFSEWDKLYAAAKPAARHPTNVQNETITAEAIVWRVCEEKGRFYVWVFDLVDHVTMFPYNGKYPNIGDYFQGIFYWDRWWKCKRILKVMKAPFKLCEECGNLVVQDSLVYVHEKNSYGYRLARSARFGTVVDAEDRLHAFEKEKSPVKFCAEIVRRFYNNENGGSYQWIIKRWFNGAR